VTTSALFVFVLEGRYSSRDDLRHCVIPVGLGNKHQEDEGPVNVDKAEIRLNNRTGFATSGERNGVMSKHRGATLIKLQELQRFGGEVVKETLLDATDGDIEPEEVLCSDIGKCGIRVTGGERRMARSMWARDGSRSGLRGRGEPGRQER